MMQLLLCFFFAEPGTVERAIDLVQHSGRVLMVGEDESARLRSPAGVPPGVAPVLSFRYMEGARRHRFGDMDLMVDDAGH